MLIGSITTGWYSVISGFGLSGAKVRGSSEFSTGIDSGGTVGTRCVVMVTEEGSNKVDGGCFEAAEKTPGVFTDGFGYVVGLEAIVGFNCSWCRGGGFCVGGGTGVHKTDINMEAVMGLDSGVVASFGAELVVGMGVVASIIGAEWMWGEFGREAISVGG